MWNSINYVGNILSYFLSGAMVITLWLSDTESSDVSTNSSRFPDGTCTDRMDSDINIDMPNDSESYLHCVGLAVRSAPGLSHHFCALRPGCKRFSEGAQTLQTWKQACPFISTPPRLNTAFVLKRDNAEPNKTSSVTGRVQHRGHHPNASVCCVV